MFEQIIKTNTFEPILIHKALGSWIWDTDGKKYLDCVSGMWCVNLGHNHPKVIQATKNQLDEIIHRNKSFLTPITLKAANTVLNYMPTNFDKLTFLNSGSEAMEFAISFAKKVTKKEKVLSLQDSYLGAFGKAKESSYTSLDKTDMKIPYPVCYEESCNCLENTQLAVDEILDGIISQIACFVLEPVMVSGGVFKPCSQFIQYICDKIQSDGGLIVLDEVTTGLGRTGKKFGYEHLGIKPDVVVLGKALGNGYPVSAIITTSDHEAKCSYPEFYYAQSHQLDPLGAAVAKEVISVFEKDSIIEKNQSTILELNQFFKSLKYVFIEEVRSVGMIFALKLKNYKNYKEEELVVKIKDDLLEEGVIVGFNVAKGLLRLLPPLTLSMDEALFLMKKIKKVLEAIN
ncbi:MAG: aspartate aminotransferase family protein [Candidatus Heimdallarchaeota archaeon]|nr:aspartate aminotransferase family protein [Candidatus Heimdallarchaeota archaeon]